MTWAAAGVVADWIVKVVALVSVDVEEAPVRAYVDVSVVSQGLYRGAARLGRLVVR